MSETIRMWLFQLQGVGSETKPATVAGDSKRKVIKKKNTTKKNFGAP